MTYEDFKVKFQELLDRIMDAKNIPNNRTAFMALINETVLFENQHPEYAERFRSEMSTRKKGD